LVCCWLVSLLSLLCCGVVVLWCCGVVVLLCCCVVVLLCCGVVVVRRLTFFVSSFCFIGGPSSRRGR
jgi:hypothetical protein